MAEYYADITSAYNFLAAAMSFNEAIPSNRRDYSPHRNLFKDITLKANAVNLGEVLSKSTTTVAIVTELKYRQQSPFEQMDLEFCCV